MSDPLDAWIAAYRDLERDIAQLDWAWQKKYGELQLQYHRTHAELLERVAEEMADPFA